ncbi:MAG: hypothetical protein IJI96_03575 [Methanobrevibacter sp.]|nr:hypothetical protein [Methanobrevibacter sp.]
MLLFVCTTGEEKVIDLITVDKSLAFMCLKQGFCDCVVEMNTDKSYDEVCSILLEGAVDMTYWDLRSSL